MTWRKHWRQKCISVFLTLLCFCYVQRKTNLLIFQTIITCSWQLKDLPAAVMQNHYCSHTTCDNTALQHNNSVDRGKLKIACRQRNTLKCTCLQSLDDELRHIQAKFLKVSEFCLFVLVSWHQSVRVTSLRSRLRWLQWVAPMNPPLKHERLTSHWSLAPLHSGYILPFIVIWQQLTSKPICLLHYNTQ